MMTPWSRLIAIIDFEATALSVDADVIEVGVAIYDWHETIQTWSSLVRPGPHRRRDEKAAAVHKIARADLQDAPEPHFVAAGLNKVMNGVAAAYCDRYRYDAAWMNNLYRTAGITTCFEFNPLEEMPRTHMRIVRMHMGAYLDRTVTPRRAGPDALRLMKAYCYARGKKPAVVENDSFGPCKHPSKNDRRSIGKAAEFAMPRLKISSPSPLAADGARSMPFEKQNDARALFPQCLRRRCRASLARSSIRKTRQWTSMDVGAFSPKTSQNWLSRLTERY